MITTNQLGNLGESKAITSFIEQGFDVYTQFSRHHDFDFVAHKDGALWKVEVRTTSKISKSGAYPIYLTGTSYGNDRSIVHKQLSSYIQSIYRSTS